MKFKKVVCSVLRAILTIVFGKMVNLERLEGCALPHTILITTLCIRIYQEKHTKLEWMPYMLREKLLTSDECFQWIFISYLRSKTRNFHMLNAYLL